MAIGCYKRHSCRSLGSAGEGMLNLFGKSYEKDLKYFNLTASIISKVVGAKKPMDAEDNPIYLVNKKIQSYLKSSKLSTFKVIPTPQSPVVTTKENFDDLLIPKDHCSRLPNDTYYLNKQYMLRTHTSAHQSMILKSIGSSSEFQRNFNAYCLSADVYRRDEIDKSHYPVFHQMEGIRLFKDSELAEMAADSASLPLVVDSTYTNDDYYLKNAAKVLQVSDTNNIQNVHDLKRALLVSQHLKMELEGLMRHLFNDPKLQVRWIEAYFPFTQPSWEMEIFFNGDWLEVLGCGVIQQEILSSNSNEDKIGWAFGIGIERIAMVLYDIPDIRLFWSKDPRFTSQFSNKDVSKPIKFKPYSKYPSCYKDISFWIPEGFHENDFMELCRDVCGDLAEEVRLIDKFERKGRQSRCYRILYRSMERTLENKEVDIIDTKLRAQSRDLLKVELR